MRRLALIAAVLTLAVLSTGQAVSQGAQPSTFYLVRRDLRMCPSPMCGGAWVHRVNHASTRCADGELRPECYVASITRMPERVWSARGGQILARGRLVPAEIDGFPSLASLATTAVWRPAGPRPARGTTFRVVSNGIRCVAAPCFSLTAFALEDDRSRRLSDVDLVRAGATSDDLDTAMRLIDTGGLLVTGTVVAVPDAGPAGTGRALQASQIWLRVPAL
jgi:Domain of unknown function (DUF6748)